MLRVLGKKKYSSGDAGSVDTSKSNADNSSSNRNRRRSRSPFRRLRDRSRSRDRKSSKRRDKDSSARAATILEANAKIGIASPEPTLGGTVHGRLSSPPSAASTACSSVGSSMSPYEQDNYGDGADAFLRMQTEKYNKMMDSGASANKSAIPANTITSNNVDIVNASAIANRSIGKGSPQDSIRTSTAARPIYFSTARSSSRLKTSSFGTIVEEEEEDIEDEGAISKRSVTFESDRSGNDKNSDTVPAPSPERFLHRPTADEKIRSFSAKVTFAGQEGGRPTSPFQRPGQNRIFLLLLEPNKKVFELIQVEYDATTATVGYILGLIKLHASEESLLRQKHVGLIRPRDDAELTDLTMLATSEGRIKHGEVLIPLPEDCRSSKCRRLAKTILKTPNVVKLLSKEQPLASRPRRRSKSRSRRSVSPGRRGTKAHAEEAMRRAALEEVSRAATKALEDKIAQLEQRLSDVTSSSSSQSGNDRELSDKIRQEIEEKARAREELEEQIKKDAEMSAAERIEQMAREAEKAAASEKPSLRSQSVQPMSFSFESEKVEESSGIAAAMESVSDVLADGIRNVKPKLRRVRNTIRSVKKRIRRNKNKPLIATSVGILLVSFFYGFFGGSTSRGDLTFQGEPSSMIQSSPLPYAIVGLILGGSALLLFANNVATATGRSRRSSALRSSSRKKGRLLRGASNIRSANMRYGPR
jgi:hypothetical protein